jgi:hypothetical protein
MTGMPHIYRGYEMEALIYPRDAGTPGSKNMRDGPGYDAAVRIRRADDGDPVSRCPVFKVSAVVGFECHGDAQRAAFAHGESVIDRLLSGESPPDK